MSALPLEAVPVVPRRTRPRLQVVGPEFVPQPPLGAPEDRSARTALVPGPAAVPHARPAAPVAAPSRPSARPSVAAPAVRGDSLRATAAAPLRLTARGVLALRALVLGIALLVVVGLGAGIGAIAAPSVEASGATVVVAPGESLWAVASAAAAPGEDVRDVVAQIAELNGLRGESVAAGQTLQLPR
ncbi:LysM peptidoglycan-binding domain-containing protein [Georgenia sp. Z1344]|uniref:LysM peptidoglycan-binding domain-containing protein n=1 Tax=Georgenia sp. Z1344 TaxID=3416706 RepID=UPI003CEC9955